jgi:hypothetical protein
MAWVTWRQHRFALADGNQTPLAPSVFGLRGVAFAPWPPDIVQRQDCPDSSFGPNGPSQAGLTQCFVRHGYTRWTSYQPASRFWPFQWIEGDWLLALSVLLIGATVWLVRRRAA